MAAPYSWHVVVQQQAKPEGVVSNTEKEREREPFQRFQISSRLMKNNCDFGGLSTEGVKKASKSDKRLIWDEASEKANYTHNNTYEALSTQISDLSHTHTEEGGKKKDGGWKRKTVQNDFRNPKWPSKCSRHLGSISDSSFTYYSHLL